MLTWHKEQQERRQVSLQYCIGQVVQPNGSWPDDDPIENANTANFDIINSGTNRRQVSATVESSLVNRFVNPSSSCSGRDNSQQRSSTTSNGEDITPWPRHPLYTCCDSRLRSYATWRQFRQFDISSLAEAGFYNTGEVNGIVIRCFFCAIELVNPAYNDNPLIEHLKTSPNCGYLKKKLREQDPFTYQERIHNTAQTSPQTDGYAGDTAIMNYRNFVSWSTCDDIRNPEYQAYSVRLASFANWPSGIKPEQLADAGFFYTGLQDVVRCFACDGGMKMWNPGDEPWIEHAHWFPQCPFVKHVKGQEFIDLMLRITKESDEEEDAIVHSTFQPNNPVADVPTLRNEMHLQTDQVNGSKVLESEVARSMLETSYSRAVVAKEINELLSKDDDSILEQVRMRPSRRNNIGSRRIADYQAHIRNGHIYSQEANDTTEDRARVTSRNPGSWSESDHIRIPQYQAYRVRLSSFARWPRSIRQSPEQMADAGFFFTDLQDVVRCFACGVGLKEWDPEDEPWTEHARWFPQCPFVKRVKGQEFIDHMRIMNPESEEVEDVEIRLNHTLTDAPTLRNELNLRLE